MNNRALYFLSPLIFIVLVCASTYVGYSRQQPTENFSGSISGRVSSSRKPLSGIVVQLLGPRQPGQYSSKVRTAEVVTDEGGNYNFRSIPPGTYDVVPVTGPYVITEMTQLYQPGRSVVVASGENVANIDFAPLLAATIKGQIKDADGHPLRSQGLNLVRAEKNPAQSYFSPRGITVKPTDAGGNYSIDSVPPGRYLLSNENPNLSSIIGRPGGTKRPLYPQTYYGGAHDPASATVIEVKPGAVLTEMDIAVGVPLRTYQIAGRVIDDKTGAPIAKVGFVREFSGMDESGFADGVGSWKTDSTGQFNMPNVLPGHLVIRPVADAADNLYGDKIEVDVTDKDVTGLEVKMHHGGTVSGKVVVEGASAASELEKMAKLQYYLLLQPTDLHSSWPTQAMIDADGNFQFVGAHPGEAKLRLLSGFPGAQSEFSILKIRRDDQDLSEEIEIPGGDDVSGLQIVVKGADVPRGIIRGEVKIEGGDLEGLQLAVMCWPIGAPGDAVAVMLDTRNHFAIEKLRSGEYELMIGPMSVWVSNEKSRKNLTRMPRVKQTVKVTDGAESEVTLTMKLNPQ